MSSGTPLSARIHRRAVPDLLTEDRPPTRRMRALSTSGPHSEHPPGLYAPSTRPSRDATPCTNTQRVHPQRRTLHERSTRPSPNAALSTNAQRGRPLAPNTRPTGTGSQGVHPPTPNTRPIGTGTRRVPLVGCPPGGHGDRRVRCSCCPPSSARGRIFVRRRSSLRERHREVWVVSRATSPPLGSPRRRDRPWGGVGRQPAAAPLHQSATATTASRPPRPLAPSVAVHAALCDLGVRMHATRRLARGSPPHSDVLAAVRWRSCAPLRRVPGRTGLAYVRGQARAALTS